MAFPLHWAEFCMFESDLAELHHSWQSWGTHCLHCLMQNFHCPLVPVKLLILSLAQHMLDISGLCGGGWNALAPTWQSLCCCLKHLLRFPVMNWRLLSLQECVAVSITLMYLWHKYFEDKKAVSSVSVLYTWTSCWPGAIFRSAPCMPGLNLAGLLL